MGYEARLLGSYGHRLLFRLDTESQGLNQHENLMLKETTLLTSAANILTDGFLRPEQLSNSCLKITRKCEAQ